MIGRRGGRLFSGEVWLDVGARFLPFADAASADLPLGRLLRLSLFQISVGLAFALLNGTLNRVMIVELGAAAWLVSAMIAIPLLAAPFRALIGFRSDHHRSFLGWRRVPFIWTGTLLQFGGLSILPFAMLVLSGEGHGPAWIGQLGAALAFLLVGAGMHTTQTAGLALATDIAPKDKRPRVVALLYVMLLLGMILGSLGFAAALADFGPTRLVQVIQSAAVATMVLNLVALWKQESRDRSATDPARETPAFSERWRAFLAAGRAKRVLIALGLGSAAFSMQDILLEPYGGEILGLSVAGTSLLTALSAAGSLIGFALAADRLAKGSCAYRLAALGLLIGVAAFSAVIFAAPLESANLFRLGAFAIGLGGGLFAVATLIAAMGLADRGEAGMALGAWGAVQATAVGGAIALGGALRDLVSTLAVAGHLGEALRDPAIGYSFVYHIEIALLFATLVAIGPLARSTPSSRGPKKGEFGLAEFPA